MDLTHTNASTENSFIHSLLYLQKTSQRDNPILQQLYPQQIHNDLIQEIINRSIAIKLASNQNLSYQYVITVTVPNDPMSRIFYCYTSLKQSFQHATKKSARNDQNNPTKQTVQAFILISHYPIPYLAYRVLNIIESAYATNMARLEAKTSKTSQTSNEMSLNEILTLFTRAYEQVSGSWPSLDLLRGDDGHFGVDVMLPFFEQNLFCKVTIPAKISGIDLNTIDSSSIMAGVPLQPEISHTLLSLGSSMLFSGKSNLISAFGPFGFIPHLWTIWELLVQGADFIVCGKDPQSVCELVLALSTLVITPLELYGSRGHLVKPFVSRDGPLNEVQDIVQAVRRRKESALSDGDYTAHMEGSYIVGITDPTLLIEFKDFTALISIPEKSQFNNTTRFVDEMAVESLSGFNPKFIAPMRYFTKEDIEMDGSTELVYSSSRLVYEDIRANLKPSGGENERKEDSKRAEETTERDRSASSPPKQIPSFFSRTYVSWTLLTEKMDVYTPGLVVFPYLPHVSPIQEIVYKKLIKLTDREYLNKGDEILREHFNQLTGSFFHTLLDSEQTHLSTKFTSFSLIQSIGDRLIPPYDLTSTPVTIYCQSFDIAFGMSHWNLKAIDKNGAEHVWEVMNIGRAFSKVEPLVVEKLPIGVKTTQRLISGRVITAATEEYPPTGLVVNKSIHDLNQFIFNYSKGKNFHILDANTWNCQRFTFEIMWWATESSENLPTPKINQDPRNMALDPWGNEKLNRGVIEKSQCSMS